MDVEVGFGIRYAVLLCPVRIFRYVGTFGFWKGENHYFEPITIHSTLYIRGLDVLVRIEGGQGLLSKFCSA